MDIKIAVPAVTIWALCTLLVMALRITIWRGHSRAIYGGDVIAALGWGLGWPVLAALVLAGSPMIVLGATCQWVADTFGPRVLMRFK